MICRKENREEEPARNDMIFFAAGKCPVNSIGHGRKWKEIPGNILGAWMESRYNALAVMIINGAGWLCAAAIFGLSLHGMMIMMIISITLVISIIDIKIRIIPNEIVGLLFITALVFTFIKASTQVILLHFLGLAIGLAILCIPFLLSSNIGAGDLKYIAVMGFCLGYPDIIEAVMIFSGILLGWLVFQLITKKDAYKMKFAMGPFISIGFVATLLL